MMLSAADHACAAAHRTSSALSASAGRRAPPSIAPQQPGREVPRALRRGGLQRAAEGRLVHWPAALGQSEGEAQHHGVGAAGAKSGYDLVGLRIV
jgi:hypothetical protein